MMNYKKLFIGFIIAVFTIVAIIIFVVNSSDNRNINSDIGITTINYVSHISSAHQKVIDHFNEKYKGRIKVESINLPFEKFSTNERKELLARYLRSKSDRIDVFTVDQIWVPRFAKWSYPLGDFFSQKEKDKLLNYGMNTCNFNDSLVALPFYLDIAVMFYRKDLLSDLWNDINLNQEIMNSISWEDLISLNSNMKINSKPFFLFPADDYEGLMCIFVELMESQGKALIENGELQLLSIEAFKSLELLVNMVDKYGMTPEEVVNFRESEIYTSYLTNNGIFLIGWPAFLNEYPKFSIHKEIFDNIQIAPIPHFKNGKLASTFGGWNLMISKFSKNVDEAVLFIKYLISEEAQSILYTEGSYLPINNKLYEKTKDDKLFFYRNLMNSGVYRPFLENYTRISDIIVEYLNKAIKKEITVDQALRRAEKKIRSESIIIK